MSEVGTVLAVTQTLFAALDSSILKDVLPAFTYKIDLRGLKDTVKTIECVLLDAGNQSALTSTESDYIQKLKDAVYDADDLFDKFFTLVDHPQSHRHPQEDSNGLADKVHDFFSFRNPFIVAYSMSRDMKKIRKKLNDIADDHARFGFSVDPRPLRRLEETHSYVHADDVVGREGDTTNVIRMLLGSDEDIGFLSIVGVPGVGKTSLAKVILGDERIKVQFPLKFWVSLSQEGGTPLNSRHVLLKILESVGCRLPGRVAMEYVQSVYQRKLRGKKFLLVLDDVWTENPLEWQNFKSFLMIGGRGSRVIVTTRSRETANIVGNDSYELEGLSKANSWSLFEMTSFREPFKDPELVKIGEKIVEKCSNVPLAIKVVGSLLNGKPIDKWQAFEANGLAGTFNGMNEIMPVLRFSYDNLEPSLKNCFAYCALFPKSYVINKEMLMNLWEAQGYIVPFYRGQSIESACEEHFCVLLQRSFFCDVKKNDFGDVESFKIHDLMHDLARNVSGTEIRVMKHSEPYTGHEPRHIFDARDKINERDFVNSKLRSYLMFEPHGVCGSESVCVNNLVKNWISVRAVAFNSLSVDTLPRTMSNLLHLRYLNLANSIIKKLPDSIANLHNLRTLNLRNCYMLSRLPKKFTKLASLTHLYIAGCERLSRMPYGMHKMRNLRVLDKFFVKDERESFRDLKTLAVNLKGKFFIQFNYLDFKNVERHKWELNCLEGAKDLKKVDIVFAEPLLSDRENADENRVCVEDVMEKLQPHCNLREFNLWYYNGNKIGSWGSAQDNWATRLPNLVSIRLLYCKHLQQLPSLSKMRNLRSLQLGELNDLEYIEDDFSCIKNSGDVESRMVTFFPSLESLEIFTCAKLQGWWRSGRDSDILCQPAFPCLSQVTITGCHALRSLPHCPRLQTLSLRENNEALKITAGRVHSLSSSCDDIKLGLIAELDCVGYLKSLAPKLLTGLYISNNVKMESLWEVEDVFKNCSSSLLTFEIQNYRYSKLKSLRGGLEHLTALHSLTLEGCNELKLEETEGMPWKQLCHNLRRLRLDRLNNIETLPDGMQYLTSLEHLQIKECEKLRALPQWVRRLQSLQSLHIESCRALISLPSEMKTLKSLQVLKIYKCPDLREACDQQRDIEWRKIALIPHIDID